MALIARGTQKPPLGAIPNWQHPMGRGHRRTILFNEGFGSPNITHAFFAAGRGYDYAFSLTAGVLGWVSGSRGRAWSVNSANTISTDGSFFPTGQATVAVITRKTDTTARAAAMFGNVGTTFGQRCGAHAPYSDGNLYWDFGGGRVTIAGLTYTTLTESWIFTGGPAGLAVWRNGVKIGTDGTARSRAASTEFDYLNGGQQTAFYDTREFTLFMVNDYQWDDDMCRWWSAEPYAYFSPQRVQRRFFVLTPGPGSGATVLLRRSLAPLGTRIGARQIPLS